jgi:hypothetical protein
MSTLDRLNELESEGTPKPFGPHQEEAIIALALDHPDFVSGVINFLKPDLFNRLECRFVIAEMLNLYEQFGVIPTRNILRDVIENKLTSSDPFEIILPIIEKPSNPRDIPIIKDSLLKWAKLRAFGLLYSEEAIEAYNSENYEYIEKIVNEANRIADVGDKGFWFLDNFEILFQSEAVEHRTTGFPRLDRCLNNGGPSPKEVVCWLAPTNVGKCHTLETKIILEDYSMIYELELDNGTIIEIAGGRKIKTRRGEVRVFDLTEDDDIIEIPSSDTWDLVLQIM